MPLTISVMFAALMVAAPVTVPLVVPVKVSGTMIGPLTPTAAGP
jgi:hypothetical protein